MRFDKGISLYKINIVEDEVGGRKEELKFIKNYYANINYLTLEETVRIYGTAMKGIMKATVLGNTTNDVDRIKYLNKIYRVTNITKYRQKTSFLLEVIE